MFQKLYSDGSQVGARVGGNFLVAIIGSGLSSVQLICST